MGKWDQYWSAQPDNSRLRASSDVVGQIYGSGYSATAESDSLPAGVWWETLREYSGGLSPSSKIGWNSLDDDDQRVIETYYNDKVLKPAMDRWLEQAKNPPGDWAGPDAAEAEHNPFLGNIAKVDANGNSAHQWSTDAEMANMDWKVTNPDSVAAKLATFGLVPIDLIGTKGAKTYQGGASTQIGMMQRIDPTMPARYGIDDQYIANMEQRNSVLQAKRRAKHKAHSAAGEGVVLGLIGGMVGLGAAGAVSSAGGGSIASGAASGAAGGGLTSAVTGNDIGKGILVGGIAGGFGAAVGDYAKQFDGMAGSAVKAGGKVVSSLVTGKDPKQALISGVGSFANSEAGGGIPGQIAGTVTNGLLSQALADKQTSGDATTSATTTPSVTGSSSSSGFGFGAAVGGFSPTQKGGVDWFDSSRYWKG